MWMYRTVTDYLYLLQGACVALAPLRQNVSRFTEGEVEFPVASPPPCHPHVLLLPPPLDVLSGPNLPSCRSE